MLRFLGHRTFVPTTPSFLEVATNTGRRIRSVYATNTGRIDIYINVAYSVPFRFPASSIVGLGLGLVVGLGSVLVLFFLQFVVSDVC